jgi:predicted HicB family RNase H-like nuclease
MPSEATTMQNEYDFSNAQRGKFYRKDATLELPIYLDPKVRDYLAARAKDKGIEVNQLVNELLKRDIELIETAK